MARKQAKAQRSATGNKPGKPVRRHATARSSAAGPEPIEHVFVLMLENRSFDHLFGLSAIHGVQPPPASFGFSGGAPDALKRDPPHEYDDVQSQMAGGTMTGFPVHGGPESMQGFDAGTNPVLASLAERSLLMDNWFSSMPGPTWPNRFFAHAASSGGLDNSPSGLDVWQAVNSPIYSYQFENGHVFDRLVREGKAWRIYRGDHFPQALALRGMLDKRLDRTFFRKFKASEFKDDLASGYTAAYTFIEPSYDALGNYANGSSQHPLGTISAGEKLIRDVYQAIFKQPIGSRSVLLITWDENGGFFDHVPPPPAVPPGDKALNHHRAAKPNDCKFDLLGPRVPALLLSPWLPAGLGSTMFPGQHFDHASIVSSLREIFTLGDPLTRRDAAAPSWHGALLAQPRDLALSLPWAPKPAASGKAQSSASTKSPVNHSVLATLEIATKLDWDLAARMGTRPLIVSDYHDKMAKVAVSSKNSDGVPRAASHRQYILDYIDAVKKREKTHEKASARK